MKTIKAILTGIRPLIMHNSQMIDPDNPFVQRLAALRRARKKLKKDDYAGQEKIRRETDRCEWEGSLYWTEDVGLYVPGENLFACFQEASKKTKSGKQFNQAVVPFPDALPIVCEGRKRNLDTLFADKAFQFRRAVRIPPRTGGRQMKVRPMIPVGWKIEIEVEFEEQILPKADLIEAIETAGLLLGLGDWRPRFGRFTAEFQGVA